MRLILAKLLCVLCVSTFAIGSGAAAEDTPPMSAPKPSPPKAAGTTFGIRPEWVSSPDLLAVMQRLHLTGVVPNRKGSLTFFRWTSTEPPRLAHLGLWGPQVTSADLARVAELRDLEYISLYETSVDDAGLAAIAGLPKLRRLAISPVCRFEKPGFGPPQWSYPFLPEQPDRPRITGRGLAPFSRLETIEELELLDARLTSSDLALLARWPKLSSISWPAPIDAAAVQHLNACPRLVGLTLGYREVAASEIEHLARSTRLRRLTIVHAKISDQLLQSFAQLAWLEELVLEDCELHDERLAHLRLPSQTKSLLLMRNAIRGPGVAHVAKFSLTTLGLEFNDLEDATLPELAALTKIGDLRLAYCRRITDHGIRKGVLQELPQLRRLNLRGLKQVTDAALDDLVRFTALEYLGLRETGVTADGIARLKQALPHAEVFK